jgi:TPR repeat protein
MKRALPLLLVAALALPAQAWAANCFDMKRAAERHAPDDELNYARALATGTCGFRPDKSGASAWYRLAAEQGNMQAQRALAEMYFSGDGVALDYVEAKRWYTKAAERGDGPSQLRLAYLNAEGHYKPLKTNYLEAERWFKKAAEQNVGDAQFRLGNFYLNYKHPPDYKQGVPWLQKAAEGGNRTAMFDLGRLMIAGSGVPKDVPGGVKWITKSADAGTLQAQQTLVEIYADGKDMPKDPLQSLKWVLKIANNPDAAVFYLDRAGDIFFDGWDTIPKNYPAARGWYERAAAKGDQHAIERLAQIYKDGLGVEKDEKKAAAYEARLHH